MSAKKEGTAIFFAVPFLVKKYKIKSKVRDLYIFIFFDTENQRIILITAVIIVKDPNKMTLSILLKEAKNIPKEPNIVAAKFIREEAEPASPFCWLNIRLVPKGRKTPLKKDVGINAEAKINGEFIPKMQTNIPDNIITIKLPTTT